LPSETEASSALLVAKCYANKCFAEKLCEALKEASVSADVRHRHMFGRDRVVKELFEFERAQRAYVVGVVDYEAGASRPFISKWFELKELESGVLVGRAKRRARLYAVIFDPNIEEALLCKVRSLVCRDPFELRRVKSSEACEAVGSILSSAYAEEVLREVLKALLKELGRGRSAEES